MLVESWTISGEGFHFGLQGLGQEATALTFPSDSLFSAIVFQSVVMGGNGAYGDFVEQFKAGDPPFVLTSTFPRAGQVLFYPAPLRTQKAEKPESNTKSIKKIKFLSEALFRQVIAGTPIAEIYPSALKLQNGEALVSIEESKFLPTPIQNGDMKLWEEERRPRVKLGRATQTSEIFFTGRVSYAPECGLWFGIRWLRNDQELRNRLAGLLTELQFSGLGAERSAGFGECTITPGRSLELPDAQGNPWVTLSRYLPRPDEIPALQHPFASYGLKSVGGWLSSPVKAGQRRRPVNLLTEGSTFGPLNRIVPGQVVDVRPRYPEDPDPLQHPVYRSGLAFAVGLQGGSI